VQIALSFDDAPDSQTTPAILEVLAEYEAHATFFIIAAQAVSHEELLREIVAKGHELGNHGAEERPSVSLTRRAFEVDLLLTHALLEPLEDARWFRPGSGWYDREILLTLDKHGYRCVLGDVYPLDTALPSPALTQQLVRWMIRPGSIVILHDRDERGWRTVETLRVLLPELRAQGYQILSVGELVAGRRSSPRTQQAPEVIGGPR